MTTTVWVISRDVKNNSMSDNCSGGTDSNTSRSTNGKADEEGGRKPLIKGFWSHDLV